MLRKNHEIKIFPRVYLTLYQLKADEIFLVLVIFGETYCSVTIGLAEHDGLLSQ